MRRRQSEATPAALLLPLVLAAVPFLLYWSATTLRGAFFFGDVLRIYYPLKVALAQALAAGRLPLWSPDLMGGYPLLAAGEGGFTYPLSLLFSLLLPPFAALNYQLLAHLALAGLGTYAYCRALGLHPFSAMLGGLVFMLSGWAIAHLDHMSITSAAAWLPVLLLLVELAAHRRRPWPYAALLALVIGLQFTAGHAQVSFLSLLAVGLYALFKAVHLFLSGEGLGRPLSLLLLVGLATGLGVALAAPQLLATLELTERSVRAGGLTGAMLTSFSLPPPYVATFFLPFLTGNPLASAAPAAAVEWCGYLGVLPLLLALYACAFRRDAYTFFFLAAAALALFLAFGQYNPLYHYLAQLPVFSSFRVPARFLLIYSLAMAVLAAQGAETLLRPGLPKAQGTVRLAPFFLGAGLVFLWGVALFSAVDLPQLLALWQYLPWGLLALGVPLLLCRGRQLLGARHFAVLAVGLLAVDLWAFNAVFAATFNATAAPTVLNEQPLVVQALLGQEKEQFRVYTRERITPSTPGVRESLFPNYAVAAGVPSLNGYLPLGLGAYAEFGPRLAKSARLADLSGVKYLLVPQSLEQDEATAQDNLTNPYAPSPVFRKLDVPPTPAVSLVVESFLTAAVAVPDGALVAEVVVSDGSHEEVFPLRAGIETAEWAHDRPDVLAQVQHARAAVARAWPAHSGAPSVAHQGYTFQANLNLSRELNVTSVAVRPAGAGYFAVDRVELVDRDGQRQSLARLAGYADYEIAYRGDAVVVYRNRAPLPRAYVVHQATSAAQAEAVWARLEAPEFDPAAEVVLGPGETRGRVERLLLLNPLANSPFGELTAGEPVATEGVQGVSFDAERIVLRASLSAPGYLVLSDTYYPGWQAYVGGQRLPVLRANWLYRAVELPAGQHEVEFRYEPAWLLPGWLLSVLAA
ncbi:MAG: hypothetical protein ACYC4L_19300, partial [Chloroflexota bacterium]